MKNKQHLRSYRTIAALHYVALTALVAATNAQLHVDKSLQSIDTKVNLDD
jgi:hypothetical protein